MEPDAYDGPWKLALEHVFEAFLALVLPEAHGEVDWAQGYRFLDKELQAVMPEGSRGEGAGVVDKLAELRLCTGEPAYAHVEVELEPDAGFTARMERYNRRLRDKLGERVTSVAVLGSGGRGADRYVASWWRTEITLRFVTLELHAYEARARWRALWTSSNPFAVVIAAHLATARTRGSARRRLYWKRKLILHLEAARPGWNDEQRRVLYRCIDWMMRLPPERQEALDAELEQLREEGRVEFVTSIERKAIERTRRDAIAKFLVARFGALSANVEREIQAVKDEEVLDRLIAEAAHAPSLEAFERTLADLT